MLRNLIYTLVAALLIWAVVGAVRAFFYSQPAKDRDLANAALETMRLSSQCRDNLVGFKLIKPEHFRCDTKGLADAHSAGRFAYNTMAILTERNDSMVKTGRNNFTIYGYQDGQQIFRVTYNYALGSMPKVTLMGKFQGETYVPTFKGQTSIPHSTEPSPSNQPRLRIQGLA
jgi:hypothetical protein